MKIKSKKIKNMFHCVRNCQTVFQSGQLDRTERLTHTMDNHVSYLYVLICHAYVFFGEVYVQVFCLLFSFFIFILKSLILTCVPKREPPSHLPPHNISLGHPSNQIITVLCQCLTLLINEVSLQLFQLGSTCFPTLFFLF